MALMQNSDWFPDELQILYRREARYRILEFWCWMLFTVIFIIFLTSDVILGKVQLFEFVRERFVWIIVCIMTPLFPIIFRLIFGSLPLEALRSKFEQPEIRRLKKIRLKKAESNDESIESHVLSDVLDIDDLSKSSALRLFSYFVINSQSLSQNIFNRAGVYLLVGVTIAFSGLGFFYSQTTHNDTQTATDTTTVLLTLGPKFGILFFIEFVALFFLKQYRSAMEEFRYYEAVKRNREETLALIRIAEESKKPFDPLELAKSGAYFSKAGVLEKEQTTEILESKKLEKNELEILGKVIEVVSNSKK